MTKRSEMQGKLRDFVKLLTNMDFEIDPDEVDYETSLDLMEQHEVLDFSEAESTEELNLAELRNLIRAVYYDGSPVFSLQAVDEETRMTDSIRALKVLNAGVFDETGDFFHFGYSPRRVIRSRLQVFEVAELKVGKPYLLYEESKPAELIKIVSIRENSFRFVNFLFAEHWSNTEEYMHFATVGLMSQIIGSKKTPVWGIKSYLEKV